MELCYYTLCSFFLTVDVPETDRDLLLSSDFLSKCGEDYLVHPKASETNRLFVKKYLNIVDPLKENNNLGRSVSKGTVFCRLQYKVSLNQPSESFDDFPRG